MVLFEEKDLIINHLLPTILGQPTTSSHKIFFLRHILEKHPQEIYFSRNFDMNQWGGRGGGYVTVYGFAEPQPGTDNTVYCLPGSDWSWRLKEGTVQDVLPLPSVGGKRTMVFYEGEQATEWIAVQYFIRPGYLSALRREYKKTEFPYREGPEHDKIGKSFSLTSFTAYGSCVWKIYNYQPTCPRLLILDIMGRGTASALGRVSLDH